MIALTYLSHATVPLDRAQLEDLLRVARARNLQNGVTGMLLYADRQFIQTLEGERADVEETMERIRADDRHNRVDVTLVQEVEERSFPEWSMGFRSVAGHELADVPGLTDFLDWAGDADRRPRDLGPAGAFHRAFREAAPREP